MLNPDKLPQQMLENIARNLGYEDDEDLTEYKDKIAQMDELQALRCFCAWHLGSRDWADFFIEAQDNLKKARV